MPDALGTLLADRYRLDAVIGQGGMGVVYRATDTRLHDRPCAVKVLDMHGDDAAARFEREVRITATLNSPHIVRVLDTGVLADDRPYIVMELLQGESLGDLTHDGGQLEPRRAVRIIDGVLSGLSDAHLHGVVHRDLKPDNVFVVRPRSGREHPVLLDFGVAKNYELDADLTGDRVLIGTVGYLAPELLKGQRGTIASDLYAVGVMLYRLLAGRVPFHPDDPVPDDLKDLPDYARIAWLAAEQAPAPLEGVSPALAAFVERLMARDIAARFPSAKSAMTALRQVPEAVGVLGAAGTGATVQPGAIAPEAGPAPRLPGPPGAAPLALSSRRRRSVWPWIVAAACAAAAAGVLFTR